MPGDDPGGVIVTILIGMAGTIVGGLVVGLVGGTGATGFNTWSILVATLGGDHTAGSLSPDRSPSGIDQGST